MHTHMYVYVNGLPMNAIIDTDHIASVAVAAPLDAKAARAACGITHAQEKQLARELAPDVAWPTLALAIALPASFLAVAWLGYERAMPLWAAAPALAVLS